MLIIYLIMSIFSCTEYEDKINLQLLSCQAIHSTNRMSYIQVYQDVRENLWIRTVDSAQIYTMDISGCSNCDLSEVWLETVKLSRTNSTSEYVLLAYSIGSTYGATFRFVVWLEDDRIWRITKLPFEVAEIRDIDNDGRHEIIEYLSSGRKNTYRFHRGILYQYKKNKK